MWDVYQLTHSFSGASAKLLNCPVPRSFRKLYVKKQVRGLDLIYGAMRVWEIERALRSRRNLASRSAAGSEMDFAPLFYSTRQTSRMSGKWRTAVCERRRLLALCRVLVCGPPAPVVSWDLQFNSFLRGFFPSLSPSTAPWSDGRRLCGF